MKSHINRPHVFRSSTAIALALTMASPSSVAQAQTTEAVVDCLVDTTNPACVEAPAETDEPASEEPQPEADATIETEAEIEVEADTETEAAPDEEPSAARDEASEAAPAEQDEAEADAQQDETETADPVVETEAEAEASDATEAQDTEQSEPTAEAEPVETEPVEDTPSDTVAEDQPTEGDAPTSDDVAEDARDETSPEEIVADDTVAPVEEPAVEDQPTEAQAEAISDYADLPSEPVAAPEAATTVIPDTATEDEAAQIRAQEDRRREEARERRNELLGAAAVGAIVGAIIPALGGRVVEDQGDRLIVERDGEFFVRRDESSLLRDGDAEVRLERLRGGLTQETITRRNGVQIITIRDEGGFVLYRSRIRRDGTEVVLIDNRGIDEPTTIRVRDLPPLQLQIPQDRYIVPARRANYEVIYDTFAAPPVVEFDETFTLRQVRENERVRDLVRRVDLDSITFETGQATVRQSQVPLLEDIARAALALVDRDPTTLLLVEGHTDAVGSEISNLALSDRRAETVASILVTYFDVPPENLIVQGYGESFLKIQTQAAEEQNRRVTIRNITPLLSSAN